MVVNNCKHDGGFMLTYDMLTHNYGWGCVRCQVYKLPFSPDAAGKIFRNQNDYVYASDQFIARWTEEIVSYPNNVKVVETEVDVSTIDSGKAIVRRVKLVKE